MWIRTQDKRRLIKCVVFEVSQEIPTIFSYTTNGGFSLGEYSTQKKALKVLDMIEKQINHFSGTSIVNIPVFQMPQDEEVF